MQRSMPQKAIYVPHGTCGLTPCLKEGACAALLVMLISIVASIVYWLFFAGQAAYTYNAFPDALYRYLVEPVMLGQAAFFLAISMHASRQELRLSMQPRPPACSWLPSISSASVQL